MLERELDKALNGHVQAIAASSSAAVNDLTGMVKRKKAPAPAPAPPPTENGTQKRKLDVGDDEDVSRKKAKSVE